MKTLEEIWGPLKSLKDTCRPSESKDQSKSRSDLWKTYAASIKLMWLDLKLNLPHKVGSHQAIAIVPWEPRATSGLIENRDAVKAKYAEQSDDVTSKKEIDVYNYKYIWFLKCFHHLC